MDILVVVMVVGSGSSCGFRDLVRDFVEVSEVLICVVVDVAGAARRISGSRITRGMTAFVHLSHLFLSTLFSL